MGSFLNVVILRLPAGMSVVRPRSRCPGCGAGIAWYDNVPVLSWLLLRARCRGCGTGISWRYPFVEALTGAIFALAAWLLVLRWRGWTGDPLRLAHLGVAQAFAAAMIALSGIDFDHRILPDRITKPGMAAGFLASLLLPRLQSPSGSWGIPPAGEAAVLSAAGMVLGYGLLWGVGWLGERVFRREAMGLGDCKLLAMIGAFAGPGGVLLAAGAGMVLGLLLGAVQHLRTRDAAFPFGPALAAGGLGAVLARRELLEGYHRAQDLMADPRGGLLLAALCTGLLLWIRGRLPRGVFLGLLVLMLVMAGLNLALLAAAPG
ncbi:MAG: prepilin peptidase [Planctomycetes bacterium]|nr:prepilin peptidase [Planctomycetota bacterium]